MQFEVITEEDSMIAALMPLLPRIVGTDHQIKYRSYGGCRKLLKVLPERMRAYQKRYKNTYEDFRIIVIIDKDQKKCSDLKNQLERIALDAGLSTKTSPDKDGNFVVVNRIAIEELEAWFFGDIPALVAAYPKIPESLGTKSAYRDPDSISGGTWETLHHILKNEGYYYGDRLPKIEVASKIAQHMDPDRNRSPSFQSFVEGVRACLK